MSGPRPLPDPRCVVPLVVSLSALSVITGAGLVIAFIGIQVRRLTGGS